jgi:hypothetical protein
MNYVRRFKELSRAKKLAALLLGSVLAWATGLPLVMNTASAASVVDFSDTISNSAPNAPSNHSINWTASSSVSAGQTIKIQFDPVADSFDLTAVVAGDISSTGGMTVVANAGACSGAASEVYPTIDSTAPDESVTLTVCPTDSLAAGGALNVTIGNLHLVNPAATQSYVIRLGGTMSDSGDTRIAIVDYVTLTAAVDTTLIFTISGVATNTTLGNGVLTSTTTSATAIQFGTLSPFQNVIGGQRLNVTTNAGGGFVVTVQQNQNLLSETGADIDLFSNGAATAVPIAWVPPTNTLAGGEATWGHYGITSDDSDLNAGEFGAGEYAGNIASPRVIFSHTSGPADGTTDDIGQADVAFRIQVGSLQEAANDYTNRITYVCTPTF